MKTDNELIAEFLGWKLCDCGQGEPHYKFGSYNWEVSSIHQLKFHKSWDALMPVVEKIHKLDKMVCINFYSEHNTVVSRIYSWGLGDDVHEKEFENESAIISVYSAVVNFIKWHNTYDTQTKP